MGIDRRHDAAGVLDQQLLEHIEPRVDIDARIFAMFRFRHRQPLHTQVSTYRRFDREPEQILRRASDDPVDLLNSAVVCRCSQVKLMAGPRTDVKPSGVSGAAPDVNRWADRRVLARC